MRANSWRGVTRRKKVRTTIADPAAARAADLVKRQFRVPAPNVLLVADFTYVRLANGVLPTGAGDIDDRELGVAALLGEPVAPLTNRAPVEFEPFGDLDVTAAIGTRQHDSGSQSQPGSTVAPPNPAFQLNTFIVGQHDLGD